MAWEFSAQIHALTGFDADTNTASEVGQATYRELTVQWLEEAAKEIINLLPPELKFKCITDSTLNNSTTTLNLDTVGKILYVTRKNSDNGEQVPCRQIEPWQGGLTEDSSNIIHYATLTDPVYWTTSSGVSALLFVKPTPTANQTAIVHHVNYPSINYDDTIIGNFPDEAEYLVPIRAAITAAEYMLMVEEDPEIFLPMIQNLKQDYNQGLQAIGVQMAQPQQAGR